jgi:hypothetical protein
MKPVHLTLGALVLLTSVLAAAAVELTKPPPVELVPTLTGKPEYCLTCHADLPQISAAHSIETFGCVLCHGGQRLALDKDLAHSTMRGGANPSDFAVVEQSCGGSQCHSGIAADHHDHIQRATTSVQATYAGAIAFILYTFGAQPDLTARYGISAVTDEVMSTAAGVRALKAFDAASFANPFIGQFGRNCLSCHTNAQAVNEDAYARFTGCAACHSPFSSKEGTRNTDTHVLTTAIPYTQCDTCHNRGNYNLRTMTFVPRSDHPQDRLHNYYQPIAQFAKCEYTLDCIDCHTRLEVMGDGDIHSNKKEIQYVRCKTCHGTLAQLPATTSLTDEDALAFRLSQLNPVVQVNVGDRLLISEKGEVLWNTRVLPDGTYELVGKASGQLLKFWPVMGSGCKQNPEEQSAQYCHECHAVER